jgi:phosphoribosyl-AMP cyclohydrolase
VISLTDLLTNKKMQANDTYMSKKVPVKWSKGEAAGMIKRVKISE